MGQMWNSVSLKDRIFRYRQLATEVFSLAETTQDTSMRAGFFALASGWHDLALELEHSQGLTGENPLETGEEASLSDDGLVEGPNSPNA